MPDKSNEVGRQLAELRRSGAAGTHGKFSKDRANTERQAVEQAMVDEGPWLTVDAAPGTLYPAPGLAELLDNGPEPGYMDDEEF